MTVLLFLAGLVLLVLGAELLVRGASRVAALAGIPPLIIGLTVVAFGTSAPELAVTLAATARGDADLAMGNVVGSNIFNVLLILGASALIVPLAVSRQLVRLEVPLMIGSAVLLLVLALDGTVSRLDGGLLLAGAVAYLVFLIRKGRDPAAIEPAGREMAAKDVAGEPEAAAGEPPDAAHAEPPARPARQPGRGRTIAIGLVTALGGLLLLVMGSRWLVRGAELFAANLGLSELVVGLTIVAAGTSLPELATSVVASIRGERDIAVGNAVGSNLMNVLLILALAALASPGGLPAAPAALHFDIPVMIGVSIACLPVFFTGLRIARWEGALFLGYYFAYTAYIVLAATGHEALTTFRTAMLFFVLPLTGVTLLLTVLRR